MPRIFDNIELALLPALRNTLKHAERADFCVGYFNLRGWRKIDDLVEVLPANGVAPCRLLVGMDGAAHDELRAARSLAASNREVDQQTAFRLRRKAAEQFREQLVLGAPTNADEEGLRRLSRQLRERKLVVKLHLRYPLHAKLYLLTRADADNPMTGYLGSSNLTAPGLGQQGELNVDVLDHDACEKLQAWFNARWNDNRSLDITDELADIIDEGWARATPIPPYHIYLKMVYHLSREARAGLSEFRIPRDLAGLLFEYQAAAVQIAAHHLNRRGGVMIGDVVGLGKTLMATALARIFEEDSGVSTLIICPTNLVEMWEDYARRYGLHAVVMSYGRVERELAHIPARFRLLIIDESHNLRNREGRRYAAIKDYITVTDSKVILLTATPYNKHYTDLSSQLRLFVDPDADIGIRPEAYIRAIGELEFIRRHQAAPRTLAAFDHSSRADDWRELMRLYLVRRTRSFIMDNYAELDPENGRKYLTFPDGTRSYFPVRAPKTLRFRVDEADPTDIYARLYAAEVVNVIAHLSLPRYGLGNYVAPLSVSRPSKAEQERLDNLSRAGQRLIGFSRTNLFKRLESAGPAFILSVDRHILRNYVYLHAIEQGLDLPLGTQDPTLLDPGETDADVVLEAVEAAAPDEHGELDAVDSEASYRRRAAAVYEQYATAYQRRFNWLRPTLFDDGLRRALHADARALMSVLAQAGEWDAARDAKLAELVRLLTEVHPNEKVLVFTQFADTVDYLTEQLRARGITSIAGVTGGSANPTRLAQRFSPLANNKRAEIAPADELRVLIATDVLSEGQNLQDARIVVNFDLPWAIIRLIQRAGRVDRIGQQADTILVYSFMPADGVERLLQLRARVLLRLQQNAEVVGSDEAFFEDGGDRGTVLDLYHEKAGLLDGDGESETDLSSQALGIWENAIKADPSLKAAIEKLPDVVYTSRAHRPTPDAPEGVLVYLRTPQDYDALAWIGTDGRPVTESQARILQMAMCHPATPALPRGEQHHALVEAGVAHLMREASQEGGQLGRPSGARYKTYVRLKRFIEEQAGTIFVTPELTRAVDEIYRYPLRQTATDTLNRQLRSGISDQQLAELVFNLRADDRLCVIQTDDDAPQEARIICSLGLQADGEA